MPRFEGFADADGRFFRALAKKFFRALAKKVPKGLVTTPKLISWVADASNASAPLVEWLGFATA